MEQLVAAAFRETMPCEVRHLGGPGDNGVDVLMITAEKAYAIQVKRRADPQKTEPVSSIREFLGAMILEGHRNGIFVSTAAQFSRAAELAAKRAPLTGTVDFLELKNARDIHGMFTIGARNQPVWEKFLTERDSVSECSSPGFDDFFSEIVGDRNWRVTSDPAAEGQMRGRLNVLRSLRVPPTGPGSTPEELKQWEEVERRVSEYVEDDSQKS
jgi:hypothetical protein